MPISYPGIPQYPENIALLETTEQVLGGQDGPSNRAAIQLADRTAYLEQVTANLQSGGASIRLQSNQAQPLAVGAYTAAEFQVLWRDDLGILGPVYQPAAGQNQIIPQVTQIIVPAGMRWVRAYWSCNWTMPNPANQVGALVVVDNNLATPFGQAGSDTKGSGPAVVAEAGGGALMEVSEGSAVALWIYNNAANTNTGAGGVSLQIEFIGG